jgi:hypothetical protein
VRLGFMGRSELTQMHVVALKVSQKYAQVECICCLLSLDVCDVCSIFGNTFVIRTIEPVVISAI